ncbi:hypothetical protein FIC06_25200 [Escherichia coli]|nr:hypothetical protein FIC06_25200 [Escherichia coli]
MQRHAHAQALLAGHRVLFHQTVVGVPLPAYGLLIRSITYLFCRSLSVFRSVGIAAARRWMRR